MPDLILRGGAVVSGIGMKAADIAISGGRISALLRPGEPADACREIAIPRRLVLPGLVDAHVHFREPGLTQKEDFDTGTRAALAGGVTTAMVMPTDEPWTATATLLEKKRRLAEGRIHIDVALQVVVRPDLAGLAEMAALGAISFEVFPADVGPDFLIGTPAAIRATMRAVQAVGGVTGISVSEESILASQRLPRGRSTVADYVSMYPPLAEAVGIARTAAIAAEIRAPVHIRQTSSAAGVDMFRRLKATADLTIETSPQLLHFTADDYHCLGPGGKASPPFRSRDDVEALRAALRDGTVDIVITDHAPHTPGEKAAQAEDFASVPGGMPGVQTLLPAMLALVDEGAITLSDLVRLCCENPAKRFRIDDRKGSVRPGADADLVVLDPSRPGTVRNADQISKAGATPFNGLSFSASIDRVFFRGIEHGGAIGRVIAPR